MVSLRHFTPADAQALLQSQYSTMTIKQIQDMIADWNQLAYQGKYFEVFAILRDETIVGQISLYQHSPSVLEIGPVVYPAHQRHGYAKKAMMLALEIARDKGYRIAEQQIRCDNTASLALHESLGFETDGYRYTNRKGHEVLIYLKSL